MGWTNYQPQLVSLAGFLNHQQYEPSLYRNLCNQDVHYSMILPPKKTNFGPDISCWFLSNPFRGSKRPPNEVCLLWFHYVYHSVSKNGIYRIYEHRHVALPRIMPRIIPMVLKPCFQASSESYPGWYLPCNTLSWHRYFKKQCIYIYIYMIWYDITYLTQL